MVGYFAFLAFRRDGIWKVSRAVAFVGLAANLVSIVARGFAAHRVPWGNMYEYSTLLAFLVVAGYLRDRGRHLQAARTLGGFALMFSVLTMATAVSFLYVGPGPLVPALNSYWIKIHVQAAIWGSSLFALGGIVTILYLVQDRRERTRRSTRSATQDPAPIMGGAIDMDAPPDLDGRRLGRTGDPRRGRARQRRAALGGRPSTASPIGSSRSRSRSGPSP